MHRRQELHNFVARGFLKFSSDRLKRLNHVIAGWLVPWKSCDLYTERKIRTDATSGFLIYIFHHAFKELICIRRPREMATNDPRVPPEVQEKIRELEQELNEGMSSAFSAEWPQSSSITFPTRGGVGRGWTAAAGILRWRAFFRFQASMLARTITLGVVRSPF